MSNDPEIEKLYQRIVTRENRMTQLERRLQTVYWFEHPQPWTIDTGDYFVQPGTANESSEVGGQGFHRHQNPDHPRWDHRNR
ncbi:hypothetical protein PN462_17520 [Spirulina sp. CS-785/01]|uniref:hypothetical protein n=1 Tax=Spirulina sp. CS-785/01 TaxID=3021716 RepID=UPI00232FBA2B|nr:hypothetical protein [Spirulina sp. CS-785/01]MDB9314917.1 hypothetical protein [Spirulina sp. CS-785/01]